MAAFPSILTIPEAAQELDLSKARVYKLIEGGQIATETFMDRMVITVRELTRFKKLSRKPGRPRNGQNGKRRGK